MIEVKKICESPAVAACQLQTFLGSGSQGGSPMGCSCSGWGGGTGGKTGWSILGSGVSGAMGMLITMASWRRDVEGCRVVDPLMGALIPLM